jgi:hypothetical protein
MADTNRFDDYAAATEAAASLTERDLFDVYGSHFGAERDRLLPVLPYPDGGDTRTSGWSGSDTSRDRARRDDTTGATNDRQAAVLRYLRMKRIDGATWKELADHFEWHHGQASGALSNLHKAGLIARLTETRDRCAVYVIPSLVAGRPATSYRTRRPSLPLDDAAAVLTEHVPVPPWHLASGNLTCLCGWDDRTDGSASYSAHLLSMLGKVAKP